MTQKRENEKGIATKPQGRFHCSDIHSVYTKELFASVNVCMQEKTKKYNYFTYLEAKRFYQNCQLHGVPKRIARIGNGHALIATQNRDKISPPPKRHQEIKGGSMSLII